MRGESLCFNCINREGSHMLKKRNSNCVYGEQSHICLKREIDTLRIDELK